MLVGSTKTPASDGLAGFVIGGSSRGVNMGFYFRKSKSFGPFRLNLSKSGVGVSTGVKGARLSIGPNGTYVNVGRNGIYYRKKISGSSSKKAAANPKQAYSPAFNCENTHSFTDAIRVSPSPGSASELSKNIIKDMKRAEAFTLGLIILFVALYALIQWWSFIPIILVRLIFSNLFEAIIKYDLDSDASLEWDKFSDKISLLKSSKKLWIIETAKLNANTKYHAGASRNISRSRATVMKIKPMHNTGFIVRTDTPSVLVKSRKCLMLFLPSDVIIKKGTRYAAYSYEQLTVYSSTTNFVETDPVPRDAEIVRYTWRYVNKNGTADKRFNNNRQIPVCRYGLVHFMVGQELSIELHTSNNLIAENVGSAYGLYKSYVNAIGSMPPTATEEYKETGRQSKASDDNTPSSNPKTGNDLVSVAAAGVSLFCDDEVVPADNTAKDICADLFEAENADNDSGSDNSLIDDMIMFLEEDENGNI